MSRWLFILGIGTGMCAAAASLNAAVTAGHPRLLGDRQRLQQLARQRSQAYERMARVAREQAESDPARVISRALVCAIEQDGSLGRRAVQEVLALIEGPIKKGHTPFGHDLALCALVYDLCYDYWTPPQRQAFHDYVNRTVDANIQSETHVFHNGWYGYKHWGIGLACYAAYEENERAPGILRALEEDWRQRAAPALELAGAGGGWAEGYYIHYWLYEWLWFCEAARFCEGRDYYADAPDFFRNRAVASMFEMYPGIGIYGSRRPLPLGDGGGRVFGGDRDKALSARRILVNHFGDDPAHQAVHAFNETTPRCSVGAYAYQDFLWRDSTVKAADLSAFKLSHYSRGAGRVYARSGWDEEATYFLFTCGDRFTAHQHLDAGHFLIFKHEELAGDGGHYDDFGSPHDVNYHLRSIAHNTILVHDPQEIWPAIRAGEVTGNDGGQAHDWPHHNGAVSDPQQWQRQRALYDIADIVACQDHGSYLYVAGDCSRAYSAKKLKLFTRQIVFLRPGTFVVFDRVVATDPGFRKTWLLQAMKPPRQEKNYLVVTNGQGRLFVQTLLPERPEIRCVSGPDLYRYGGKAYPPRRDTGPAPACRIEVACPTAARADVFLHVLTATDADVDTVEPAVLQKGDGKIAVRIGGVKITFFPDRISGYIEIDGQRRDLAAGAP
ncbi:MAG: heparinase II/III family protein [Sedimentisphaerales bacterium]|nr:heparinase II/III family protein [Sedimentisphaerales bacterium]